MQRILCVANWSEGLSPEFFSAGRRALSNAQVHYFDGDEDHNRSVSAFSGTPEQVGISLLTMCDALIPLIDMRTHKGVHPRIGALDVCPFIILKNSMQVEEAIAWSNDIAKQIAERFSIPIFLYEKSETGRHSSDLPSLRKGQFEGLAGKTLNPDFGTTISHPQWGATVFGVRDWLLAANINLNSPNDDVAKLIAKKIRTERDTSPILTGIRALGFELASKKKSQVSMNFTTPDKNSFDDVYDWVITQAQDEGIKVSSTELIGVIRPKDAQKATHLDFSGRQIVE